MGTVKKITTFLAVITVITNLSFSQTINVGKYVNPFIGTTKSDVVTKWGDDGGTYPGAVAPSGFIQLTPETSISGVKGYDYSDSSIYFFSCFHHASGYPEGSSGSLYIMPVDDTVKNFQINNNPRPFSHFQENATAGYYSVLFHDDGTLVETSAAQRSGMFRITFPAHIVPKIFIGDAGDANVISKNEVHLSSHHAVIHFSEDYSEKQATAEGIVFTFPASSAPVTFILKIAGSTVSFEGAQKNIEEELGKLSFGGLREKTQQEWNKELSVVDIEDSNEKNKTIFYTALYHSLLVPWIISDVDGNYSGYDRTVHHASGKNEYGEFSPWDTFRSLHPLLCLLYPEKQKDMMLSMLDVFKQTHHLPTESMTGNHAVAILVDSYLKGISGIDSNLLFEAMKRSIMYPPFRQNDLAVYQQKGYVPFLYPESVTRTVEYAYDDWALSQYAKQVMHDNKGYDSLIKRSSNYKNLFNAQELFLLPRNENEIKLQPGNSGYKEGDKWVYSYFVPQDANDLINLMGGDDFFATRLDNALTEEKIIFDNETVFHLPYFFNEANRPDLTQKWLDAILRYRFNATPGGLPGNDDLGAVSSWYVLSAMGIFPFCPGRPYYTLGSPVFNNILIHLANGKRFSIKSIHPSEKNKYVRSVLLNNQQYNQTSISHAAIEKGGELVFTMCDSAHYTQTLYPTTVFSETKSKPVFNVHDFSVSANTVKPDELVWAYFSINNPGTAGTKVIQLFSDEKEVARKNCFVDAGNTSKDSIGFRLYAFGKRKLSIREKEYKEMDVMDQEKKIIDHPEITNLSVRSVIAKGTMQEISFKIKNIGGAKNTFRIPILLNDSLICYDTISLGAGLKMKLSNQFNVYGNGIQKITVENAAQVFKTFQSNTDAEILSLSFADIKSDSVVIDHSGFNNNGKIIRTSKNINGETGDSLLFGKDCYVEIGNAPSLDEMDETLTMMLWVYPTRESFGLVDIFSKGDNNVLQLSNNKTLTFFAGGWGRGDCTVELPADWKDHWHHLAGVCDGNKLSLYIDGNLKGAVVLKKTVNLSVGSKWTIGRNEEFPLQRIFNGYIKNAKVFARPLAAADIITEMHERF